MPALFASIRESCAVVAAQARWVGIDRGALERYAEVAARLAAPLAHTAEHHLLGRGEETLAFFVILDTVNFGSGYFPHLRKDGASGYFTVAKALKRHCEAHGIPTPQALARVTAADCATIFGQDIANLHAQELMTLFALALNALGRWVMAEHAGAHLRFLRGAARAEGAARAPTAI